MCYADYKSLFSIGILILRNSLGVCMFYLTFLASPKEPGALTQVESQEPGTPVRWKGLAGSFNRWSKEEMKVKSKVREGLVQAGLSHSICLRKWPSRDSNKCFKLYVSKCHHGKKAEFCWISLYFMFNTVFELHTESWKYEGHHNLFIA